MIQISNILYRYQQRFSVDDLGLLISIISEFHSDLSFDEFYYHSGGSGTGISDSMSKVQALGCVSKSSDSTFRFRCDLGNQSALKVSLSKFSGNCKILACAVDGGGGGCLIKNIIESWQKVNDCIVSHINNSHYIAWQYCNDPRQYARKFGSVAGFRIIEKVLSEPLGNVKRLDIGKNPGRSQIQGWFPKHVASEMWLGAEFWEHENAKKGPSPKTPKKVKRRTVSKVEV